MDFTNDIYTRHPVQMYLMIDHVVELLKQRKFSVCSYSPQDDQLLDHRHLKESYLYISFYNPSDAWIIFNMLRETLGIDNFSHLQILWINNHNYIHFAPEVAEKILTRLLTYLNLYEG